MNMSADHARLLLEKACEHQYVLERLADDVQAPDSAIGFHAQQATEKLLKAVLTNRGIVYGRTHDLDLLLDLLRDGEIPRPPDAERLAGLTPYAVVPRPLPVGRPRKTKNRQQPPQAKLDNG